jgi:drug/metabolite transporter (DMT)-like permease
MDDPSVIGGTSRALSSLLSRATVARLVGAQRRRPGPHLGGQPSQAPATRPWRWLPERTGPRCRVGASLLVGFFGYGLCLTLFFIGLRMLCAARTGAYFSVAHMFDVISLAIWSIVPGPFFGAAAALMALGVWLHVREGHLHQHTDEPLEHSHPHRHDVLTHKHPHYPDIHHRHSHSH